MSNKPNLFIPGFAKCGTSSLHSMLIQHSEVSSSFIKEPHTYTRDYRYYNRFNSYRGASFNKLYRGLNVKYVLDSSTGYIVYPPALDRIRHETSDAKFIIVCRDPVERIVSHYNWMSSLGYVELEFEEEIIMCSHNVYRPEVHYNGNYKNYIEVSRYGRYLSYIYDIFDHENILLLKFENMLSDWHSTYKSICNFLQISEENHIELKHENKTGDHAKTKAFIKKYLQDCVAETRHRFNIFQKSVIVQNPINKPVKISDIDISFLKPYLESDIRLYSQLGFNLDKWDTTKKMLGKE